MEILTEYINAGDSLPNTTERTSYSLVFSPVEELLYIPNTTERESYSLVLVPDQYTVTGAGFARVLLSGGTVPSAPAGWTPIQGGYTKDFPLGMAKADVLADFAQTVTKTGYSLAWQASEDTVSETGMTLTATWTPIQYTLSFDTVNGSAVSPITYTVESSQIDLATSAISTRRGYTFAGWYDNAEYSGDPLTAITPSETARNLTLYAKWGVIEYTITYHVSPGINAIANPLKYTVESSAITFADPSRSYYNFSGWYTDAQGTTQITGIPAGSIGDVEIWAKWTPITYTITFQTNSGSAVSPITYTVESSQIDLETQAATRRAHYDFQGWYREDSFANKVTTITPASEHQNLTLYAYWTPHKYTITYNAGQGTASTGNPTYYTVETASLTIYAATGRTGYTCTGWGFTQVSDDTASGESDSSKPASFTITLAQISTATGGAYGNITLYAKYRLDWYDLTIQWSLDVTKVYRRVNVSGSKTKKFPYGSNISTNIASAGMDPNHTVAYAYGHTYTWTSSNNTMPAQSVTATATYTLVPHTLTLYKKKNDTASNAYKDTVSGFGDANDWIIEWVSAYDPADTSTDTYEGWHLSATQTSRTTIPTWTQGTTVGTETSYTIDAEDTAKYWAFAYESGKRTILNITDMQNLTLYAVPFLKVTLTLRAYDPDAVTIVPAHHATESETLSVGGYTSTTVGLTHRVQWHYTIPSSGYTEIVKTSVAYATEDAFTAQAKTTLTPNKYKVQGGSTEYSFGTQYTFTANTVLDLQYVRSEQYKRRYDSKFYDDRRPAGENSSTFSTVTVWSPAWTAYSTVKATTHLSGTAPAAIPGWTKDGLQYTYHGWTTAALFENGNFIGYGPTIDDTGVIHAAGSSVDIGADYIYYAVWKGQGTVSYVLDPNRNGGGESWAPNDTPEETTITLTGYIGSNMQHQIISNVPVLEAGTYVDESGRSTQVDGWYFDGWVISGSSVIYSATGTYTTIAVKPGQKIVLTVERERMYTRTISFLIAQGCTMSMKKTLVGAFEATIRENGAYIAPSALPRKHEADTGITWTIQNSGTIWTIEKVGGVWTCTTAGQSPVALTSMLNAIRPTEGYTFRGWSASNLEVQAYSKDKVTLTTTVSGTVYSIYSPKFTVEVSYYTSYTSSVQNVVFVEDGEPVKTVVGPIDAGDYSRVDNTTPSQTPSADYWFVPSMSGTAMTGYTFEVRYSLTTLTPTGGGVFNGWDDIDTPAHEIDAGGRAETPVAFNTFAATTATPKYVADWTTQYTLMLYYGIPEDNYKPRYFGPWVADFGNTITINAVSKLGIPTDQEYVSAETQAKWHVSKIYLGQTYDPDGVNLSTGPIVYTPENDGLVATVQASSIPGGSATIRLFAECRHSTYRLLVNKGANDATAPETYIMPVTYGESNVLDISDFATSEQIVALEDGGHNSFMGFARTIDGTPEYSAGIDYYGTYLNALGAYPEENSQVVFYATWGKFVTTLTESGVEIGPDKVTIRYIATPTDAANPTIVLDSQASTGSVPVRITRNSNVSTVELDFSECDAGTYSFTFKPININASSGVVPSSQIQFKLSTISFENTDATAGNNVILPARINWIRRSTETVMDRTWQLGGYRAASGDSQHIHGGWTLTQNGALESAVTLAANATESKTLYAAWTTDLVYDLDGGVWPTGTTPANLRRYYTDYTGQTIQLTNIVPLMETRTWSAWEGEGIVPTEEAGEVVGYSVPARAGAIVVHAVWSPKNLEWAWASTEYSCIGPVAWETEDHETYEYLDITPAVSWIDQTTDTVRAIAFNTQDNVISHVTDLAIPYGNQATVELYVMAIANPLWAKSFVIPGESLDVTIPFSQFPKVIFQAGVGYVTGLMYRFSNPSDPSSELIPINGSGETQVTLTLTPGETVRIYVDPTNPDYTLLTPSLTETKGVSILDASYTQVRSDMDNTGNWIVLSNKYAHTLDMRLPQKPAEIRTYKLVTDSSGYWIFNEIYASWLAATGKQTQHFEARVQGATTQYVSVETFGATFVSERADEGLYAVDFVTYPEAVQGESPKEKHNVLLLKILDELPLAPLCVVTKYPTKHKEDMQKLYLSTETQPNLAITNVRRKVRVQLNQSPMLTKSSEFNYIIDLGNLETCIITVTRTPPAKPNDRSHNPADWSTNKWVKYVKTFFDQWQNSNYDVKEERSGGYNLILDPLISYNGYPKIDKNVFLSAPLQYPYNRAGVTLTLQFTVASMRGRNAIKKQSIVFRYVNRDGQVKGITLETYNGVYIAPQFPEDVLQEEGTEPACWAYTVEESAPVSEGSTVMEKKTVTRYAYPGDELPITLQTIKEEGQDIDSTQVFTIKYRRVLGVVVFEAPVNGSYEVRIPHDTLWNTILEGNTHAYAKCIAVGGGGGGGSSYATGEKITGGNDIIRFKLASFMVGGGGGSGFTVARTVHISKEGIREFSLTLGAGGASEINGESSEIRYGSALIVSAGGGEAGGRDKRGTGAYNGGENSTSKDVDLRWDSGEAIKGSQGSPTDGELSKNSSTGEADPDSIRGGMGYGAYPNNNPVVYPSSGGAAANINRHYRASSNIWVVSGRSATGDAEFSGRQAQAKLIRSLGGCILSQTATSTKDPTCTVTSSAGNARYGGGGCSKLRWQDYDLNIKEMVEVVKVPIEQQMHAFSPGGAIINAFNINTWKAALGVVTNTVNYTVNYVHKALDYGACTYTTPGGAGADGVIIIEFLGDVINNG